MIQNLNYHWIFKSKKVSDEQIISKVLTELYAWSGPTFEKLRAAKQSRFQYRIDKPEERLDLGQGLSSISPLRTIHKVWKYRKNKSSNWIRKLILVWSINFAVKFATLSWNLVCKIFEVLLRINRHIKKFTLKISNTMKKGNNISESNEFPCETNFLLPGINFELQ